VNPDLPSRWCLFDSGRRPAAENMSWDEALLEASASVGHPILRVYGWSEPAATFGYFQKFNDVSLLTSLRPLIRRPTGGGLVPHDADWTYSLIIPPHHPWYELKAVESYRRMHEWIRAAFARMGAAVELAPVRRKEAEGQCFAGAEQFDLVGEGRKIAGAAQRRTRHGLLIQGSVQPPLDSLGAGPTGLLRADYEQALVAEARGRWGVEWSPFQPDEPLRQRVEAICAGKYSQAGYNQQR
jgi:lipoate-protein ligase A